jgi:hypothetical protein
MLALLLAAAQLADPTPALPPDCTYDLEAMLALDRQAFDQTLPDGGWRALGKKDGCEIAAAELIREWRHEKRDHEAILYWHEGQMRAFGGQTAEAIALFQRTYNPPEFDQSFGWNFYVSGTIAFLLGNREHLRESIAGLKSLKAPKPEDNSLTLSDGTVIQMSWPPNLNVLEAFERCWGKIYKEAYSSEACAAPKP